MAAFRLWRRLAVLGSDTPANSCLGTGDQQPAFLGLLWARQEAGTGEADLAGY